MEKKGRCLVMNIRKLTEVDYISALELFFELDKLHAEARPDWFVERARETIFPQDAFTAGVKDPECLFLGAFDAQGAMAGLVRATLWEDSGMVKGLKNVCLDNLYVRPRFRHQGIASELYRAVESWAKELGAKRVELHVWAFNEAALTAYQAWGMKPQRYVLEKEIADYKMD